jgi:RIO-like serine/threonine protein kinase
MQKSDIEILKILYTNDCSNELKSYSITKILQHTKYRYSKVHNDLNKLCTANLIEKGLKSERAETFYITEKGKDELRRLCS